MLWFYGNRPFIIKFYYYKMAAQGIVVFSLTFHRTCEGDCISLCLHDFNAASHLILEISLFLPIT